MGVMKNIGTLIDIHVCLFDTFQHISSCHIVRSDQHLPMNCFETNKIKLYTISHNIEMEKYVATNSYT